MCLKIHDTYGFAHRLKRCFQRVLNDRFFSKNSYKINDHGADHGPVMETLHVPKKSNRNNWSAVLQAFPSCNSIFSITKLSLVSKLSWRSGTLTRGSCMAIICPNYSHFYHAVDFYSTYISCSPLRWHFYHGFRGAFYPVDEWLLTARVFTLQALGNNIQDSSLTTRKDFWLAVFDQRWADMKRLQEHYYVERGRSRAREKCLARIKKKFARIPSQARK